MLIYEKLNCHLPYPSPWVSSSIPKFLNLGSSNITMTDLLNLSPLGAIDKELKLYTLTSSASARFARSFGEWRTLNIYPLENFILAKKIICSNVFALE